jgi:hypothetical protein
MKTSVAIFLLAGLCLCSAPLLAHHGYAAYDMLTTKTVKGTVTTFIMANPHSQINMDVKDDTGKVDHWVMEDAATVRGMRASGFEFDTLKPGDEVTIEYRPAKGSVHAGLVLKVTLANGDVLPHPRPGGNDQSDTPNLK